MEKHLKEEFLLICYKNYRIKTPFRIEHIDQFLKSTLTMRENKNVKCLCNNYT